MSLIVAATSDQAVVRPDEDRAFWDLVYAEDDWLRAEFDAIVTLEYPDRRLPGPRPSPRWPAARARGSRLEPRDLRPRAAEVPVRLPARQRSPPGKGLPTLEPRR